VEYPYVTGRRVIGSFVAAQEIQLDLRTVSEIEVLGDPGPDGERSVAKKILVGVGVAALVAAVVLVVVLATKESCPILYVDGDDGPRQVGEAYAGAAFRSIQREDLLPVPGLGEGPVRLFLANEARETQFTDLAEVVVADHPPGTRVVSTHESELLAVSASRAPASVTDLAGTDVTPLVAAADGVEWMTDLRAAAAATAPDVREGLVARFPAPAPGARPVLELELANTAWLDLVFGRYFALMGEDLDKYLEMGNHADAGPRILGWREREGVDLRVEVARGDAWEPVATVPSVGPVALRRVAVPLPAPGAADAELTVRISGGAGFWRVDGIALSVAEGPPANVRRVAPRAATGPDGRDELAALTHADGRYQELVDMDDRLLLEYDLPAVAPGHRRSAFFRSSGYYNVHPPIQGRKSLLTLKTLRDREGSFARFGLDLFRRYGDIAAAAPVLAVPAPDES
jgi:hypothetical protein